jgi:LytB protein
MVDQRVASRPGDLEIHHGRTAGWDRDGLHTCQRHRPQTGTFIDTVEDGGAAQSVFEVCWKLTKHIYRVGSKEEIQPEWFQGVHSVAILGGILVPQWTIEETAHHVRALCS